MPFYFCRVFNIIDYIAPIFLLHPKDSLCSDIDIINNLLTKSSVNLNVRPETIKLLEENIGKTVSDIHHSRILYDPPPRILEIKAKINTGT